MSFLNEGLYRNRATPRVARPISLKRILARLKAHWTAITRRKQVYALAQLDDRTLADIGVTRADVQEAARWSLWGDPGERLAGIAEERRAARERAASAFERRPV